MSGCFPYVCPFHCICLLQCALLVRCSYVGVSLYVSLSLCESGSVLVSKCESLSTGIQVLVPLCSISGDRPGSLRVSYGDPDRS